MLVSLVVAAFVLGLVLLASMAVSARMLNVCTSEIAFADLPPGFDGVTILFAADLHIDDWTDAQRTFDVFSQLQASEAHRADLLLLGGDYTSLSALPTSVSAEKHIAEQARRAEFFELMASLDYPMGKFLAAGNHDNALDASIGANLADDAALGGFTVLRNSGVRLMRQGEELLLLGLDDLHTGHADPRALAKLAAQDAFSLVLSHNPDAIVQLNAQPASDRSANWVDLMLSGHTHGGQIRLFGWMPKGKSAYGERLLSGWKRENAARVLVSNGMGTTGVPLRLGAPPQVHLITLRCA